MFIDLTSLFPKKELTHFLHGHNIFLPTTELLNAKAKKLFTPCKYVLVCLHETFMLKAILYSYIYHFQYL
jgi:hypothetical protein